MANGLLVVGDSGALTAGDTQLQTDLVFGGHSLTVVSDESATPAQVAAAAFTVVAASTSSTTTNSSIGSALASSSGVVISGNDGSGIIPTLSIAFGSITSYRASASTITLVDVPDTAYDGGVTASGVSFFSPGGPGSYLRQANLGTGAILVATNTGAATEAAIVAYPAGATLANVGAGNANGSAAPGGRAFITMTTWASRTTDARTLLLTVLSELLSGGVPLPTVDVEAVWCLAGESVSVEAGVEWGGADTTATIAWSSTGGSFDNAGVNPAVFSPSGVGDVTVTCTITGTSGGSAQGSATVTVLDTTGRQVSTPQSLAVSAGVTAAGGGSAVVADLADTDMTTGVDIPADDSPIFVRLTDLASPEAGTGAARVLCHLWGDWTSADVRVELVNAPGITDAAARDGGGTVVGTATTTVVTATRPLHILDALTTGDVAALDPDDHGIRITVTAHVGS